MRIKAITVALLVLVALVQVSCGQTPVSPRDPTPEDVGGSEPSGHERVAEALRARGAKVDVVGRQDATYFGGAGYELLLNGVSLRVFDYADEAGRVADSEAISPDGWEITRQDGDMTVVSHLEWIDQPNFWVQEDAIVLYVGRDEATQRLLSSVLGVPITAPTLLEEGYPRAAVRAQEMARAVSSLVNPQIDIVSYEPVTWNDACLGAGRADEVCAEVITPGWIVVIRDPNGQWFMHTDLFGERMRRGPDVAPAETPEPTATPTIMPSATPTPLPTPTGLPPTPTVAPGAQRLFTNPFYGVSFLYPDHWQHQEGEPQSGERYGGSDGFFLLGAMDAGDQPLDIVAANEAGHVLRPYGTDPTIDSLMVAGQEARLILPSADQSMGSLGQALLIIRFPVPVEITEHVYPLFTLTADPAHILDLASTLVFTAN